MNFLFPLYLLGLAALSVPIFLHLRNRELKKRVPFSSLRFLKPTRIEQKQRAKLENLLLLLLRCAILGLLAMAFSRPFLKQDVLKNLAGETRQVVLLLDTSASMRSEGVWDEALERTRELIDDLDANDELQMFTFDKSTRLLHSFDAWREPASIERKATLLAKLETVEPTWRATDLGQALISAVESFRDALEDAKDEAPAKRVVYLVSDQQEGANVESLGQYNWPLEVELVQERVGKAASNASLQLLPRASGIAELQKQEDRFRLTNDRASKAAKFRISWQNADGTAASSPISVTVPPGETEIITAPKTTTGIAAPVLVLEGDETDFDNRNFQSPPVAKPLRILYYSDDDPNKASSPLFFFQRALIQTDTFKPELTQKKLNDPLQLDWSLLDYVVLSEPAGDLSMAPFRKYLEDGGRGLFLLQSPNAIPSLGKLLDLENLPGGEVTTADFALLGKINRRHPYLQGFTEARFADFSKIHYWKYRKLDISKMENTTPLASFDNGDPAWFEVPVGNGSLLVMTAGWHREDSQLALSTKFIPLLYAILTQDPSAKDAKRTYLIDDQVPLTAGAEKTVTKPDGSKVTVSAEAVFFAQTDQPGLYEIAQPGKTMTVAVNLSPDESRLSPLESDEIKQLLKLDRERSEDAAQGEIPPAKLSIEEQEGRQKWWLWLLYAVLILVLIEILYSAKCAQPKAAAETV